MTRLCLWIFSFCFVLSSIAEASGPQRLVSLAPSITETLFALSVGDRVVGVTDFCDRPPEALKKQKVGGMTNPSLETILLLRPDLVLLTPEGNPREIDIRLKRLGINTYVFKAKSIADLPGAIRDLGRVLDVVEKADALADRIQDYLNNLRAQKRNVPAGRAVFIIWPQPLLVAGPDTAIDEALRLLGWHNIASDAMGRYPKYSVEELLRRNPDVILIGQGHEDMQKLSSALLKRLSSLEAVRKGRVFYVSDKLYRLSPGVIEGIEELKRYLQTLSQEH